MVLKFHPPQSIAPPAYAVHLGTHTVRSLQAVRASYSEGPSRATRHRSMLAADRDGNTAVSRRQCLDRGIIKRMAPGVAAVAERGDNSQLQIGLQRVVPGFTCCKCRTGQTEQWNGEDPYQWTIRIAPRRLSRLRQWCWIHLNKDRTYSPRDPHN